MAAESGSVAYKHQRRRLPRYCYMMTAPSGNSYIGLASNPFHRLRCQNREPGFPSGAKATKADSPSWKITLVLGPFYRGGRTFKKAWKARARKSTCRVRFAILAARMLKRRGLRVYSNNKGLLRSVRDAGHSVDFTRRVVKSLENSEMRFTRRRGVVE